MPNIGLTVTVPVLDALWIGIGQPIFVQGAGVMAVASKSGNTLTLSNPGQVGSAQPGLTILSGAQVSPGGLGGNAGNAFTSLTAAFIVPAVNATVQIQVLNTQWMVPGEPIFISNAGTFLVSSLQSGILVTVVNLGYPQNVAPTTNVPGGQSVTPTGFNGQQGATGIGTLNVISPTTTKGDIIVDNGSNHPLASDVRLAVGSDGQALVVDATQATGLKYFSITPNAAATDGDIAIFSGTSGKPMPVKDSKMLISATGALQSTPSGGNARGTSAIDLQVVRVGATQVASGNDSAIGGGQNNTASAVNSTVSGGTTNAASGSGSAIGGGNTNIASASNTVVAGGTGNQATQGAATVGGGSNNSATGIQATVAGGNGNTASGGDGTVSGGNANVASGTYATVPGGFGATAYLNNQVAHAGPGFFAGGSGQTSELLWNIATSDGTANVESFIDGIAARAVIPLNTTWAFVIHTIARSSAGVCAMWETKGAIQNNANTVSLVAAVSQSVIADGTGATWGVTANHVVSADNVNKSLKIAVTGAVATTISWVTHARLVEVQF